MLPIALVAQLLVAAPACATRDLCEIIRRAEATRAQAIAAMRSMEATAESDIALLERTGDSLRAIQLEQVRSLVRWRAADRLEQRIVAYRSSPMRSGISTLTLMPHPWVIASPGGGQLRNALRVPLGGYGANAVALHPLDPGHDSVYMMTADEPSPHVLAAGDTLIVHRVHVAPRGDRVTVPALAFHGFIELESRTGALVRMRGDVVHLAVNAPYWRRLAGRGVQTAFRVELTYAPSRYGHWIPVLQRLELHATSSAVDGVGVILRVTTRLSEHRANRHRTLACGTGDPGVAAACLTTAPAATINAASWAVPLDDARMTADLTTFDQPRSAGPSTSVEAAETDAGAATAADDTSWTERWRDRADAVGSRMRVSGMRVGTGVRRTDADGSLRGALVAQWRGRNSFASAGIEHELVRGSGLLPMPAATDGSVAILGGSNGTIPARTTFAGAFGRSRVLRMSGEVGPADATSAGTAMPCAMGFRESNRAMVGGNLRAVGALNLGSRVTEAYGSPSAGAGIRVERVDCQQSAQHWNGFVAARSVQGAMSWSVRIDAATATRTPLAPRHFAPGGPVRGTSLAHPMFVRRHAARVRLAGALDLGAMPTPLRAVAGLRVASDRPSLVGTIEGNWRQSQLRRPAGEWDRRESLDTRVEVTLRPLGGALGVGVGRSVTDDDRRWRVVLVLEAGR